MRTRIDEIQNAKCKMQNGVAASPLASRLAFHFERFCILHFEFCIFHCLPAMLNAG
jgi:hypothetical protein